MMKLKSGILIFIIEMALYVCFFMAGIVADYGGNIKEKRLLCLVSMGTADF